MKYRRLLPVVGMLLLVLLVCGCQTQTGRETDMTDRETKGEGTDMDTEKKETEAMTEGSDEPSIRKTKSVICVGDSITYGVGASYRELTSYPARLATELGQSFRVGNFGVSCAYMIDRTDYPDFRYGSEQSVAYRQTASYQASIACSPDIVLIALGANDAYVAADQPKTAEYFRESALALVKTYQQLPSHPTVYLLTPPSRFDSEVRRANVQTIVIPALREVAAQTGCTVVDLFTPTDAYAVARDAEWFGDGIHPTDRGYRLFAEILAPILKEELR